MARKATRGNTDKNYYDNTRFTGTLATGDPVPEGMFRHLVNFDISDTGQSITPRKGFLSTTIVYNNSEISLSDKTIIYRDPEKGVHIIFDPEIQKAYVIDISKSSLSTGTLPHRLKVEKEIDIDYLETFDTFLKEFENFKAYYQEQVSKQPVTKYLKQTTQQEYDEFEYSPTIKASSNDLYILESDLDKIQEILPSKVFNHYELPYWEDDQPIKYKIGVPVVKDESSLDVINVLWFTLEREVFVGNYIYESKTSDIYTLIYNPTQATAAKYKAGAYTQEIKDFLIKTHTSSVTAADTVMTYCTEKLYLHRFYYTYVKVTASDSTPEKGYVLIKPNLQEIENLCGPGYYPVKTYTTDEGVLHLSTYAYESVHIPRMMVFDWNDNTRFDNGVLLSYVIVEQYLNIRKNFYDRLRLDDLVEIAVYDSSGYNESITLENYPDLNFCISPKKYTKTYKIKTTLNIPLPVPYKDMQNPLPAYDYISSGAYKGLYKVFASTVAIPSNFVYSDFYTYDDILNNEDIEDFIYTEIMQNYPTLKYLYNSEYNVNFIVAHPLIDYPGIYACVFYEFTISVAESTLKGIPMYETLPRANTYLVPKAVKERTKINLTHTYPMYSKMFVPMYTGTQDNYLVYKYPFKYNYYIPVQYTLDSDEFKSLITDEMKHNIRFTTDAVFNYVDEYSIARVINRARYADVKQTYPITLSYRYTGEKLLVGAIDMQEQTDMFSPNLASRLSRIPDTLQYVYSGVERPSGHVNSTPYVLIDDAGEYRINFIHPNKNYKFIPVFVLNPADYTAADYSKEWSWAIKVQVTTGDATLNSNWYDINTHMVVLDNGVDILLYDNTKKIFYIDTNTIKKHFTGYTQLTVIFMYVPYDKDSTEGEDAVWTLKALKSNSGVAVVTYDPFKLKTSIPTEPHEDADLIRKADFVVFKDNRLVMWYANTVWISNEGVGYFLEENKFTFNEKIVKVLPFKDTLLVFTVQNLYVVYQIEQEISTGNYNKDEEGNDTTEIKEKQLIFVKQAVLYNILVSDKYKNVIQIFNQNILFYSEEGQLYLIKPSTQIDSDTRYTLQMFNKNVNDILANYDTYINERLEQYGDDRKITKEDVSIDAQVSINDIKIFYYVPGVITYVLKYNVLTNQFSAYDTLTFTKINSLHFIEGGEMYITETNKHKYITLPFSEDNVDMTVYDTFQKVPINALLDTGNLNLNNHIYKRYRDLRIVFKNLSARHVLFKMETIIDDVISHPFKNTQLEIQELDGKKTYVTIDVTGEEDLLDTTMFDFSDYLSNKLITYRTSILGTGKVFRVRFIFTSKGRYKIQEFGIIYKERSI